jgi:hypothetical protein
LIFQMTAIAKAEDKAEEEAPPSKAAADGARRLLQQADKGKALPPADKGKQQPGGKQQPKTGQQQKSPPAAAAGGKQSAKAEKKQAAGGRGGGSGGGGGGGAKPKAAAAAAATVGTAAAAGAAAAGAGGGAAAARRDASVPTLEPRCMALLELAEPPDLPPAFDEAGAAVRAAVAQLERLQDVTGLPVTVRDARGRTQGVSLTGWSALLGIAALVMAVLCGVRCAWRQYRGHSGYTLVTKAAPAQSL